MARADVINRYSARLRDHIFKMDRWTLTRVVLVTLLGLLGLNVLFIALFGGYDFYAGPIHIAGGRIFKPLRWITVALLPALILVDGKSVTSDSKSPGLLGNWFPLALVTLIVAAYYDSLAVNLDVFEWDHRDISATLQTPADFLSLFTGAQPNGFYRPITYISLWFDYAVFKTHLWAYHLQNLIIHFLNSLVVFKLGRELSLGNRAARAAALLFSVTAINFESVLWPAARFDLLATLFTLLGTIFFLRYLKHQSVSDLVLSLACFAAGVLNKESAYSFVLIAGLVAATDVSREGATATLRTRLRAFLPIALLAVALVALRFLVGGGGYRNPGGESPHFQVSAPSVFSYVTNVAGLTSFALNTSMPLPGYIKIAVTLFVISALAVAVATKPSRKTMVVLVALLLVSAIPVFSLVGWIRPSLQNARFLYLPAVWMSLLLGVAVVSVPRYTLPILAVLLLSSAFATHHNIAVYKEMLKRTEYLANLIHQAETASPSETVYVVGIPEAPDGVFYFASELASKLKKRMPDLNVVLIPAAESPPARREGKRIYQWNAQERTLVLQP